MKIAVIPARGGSKRIPRKNIRLFAGVPMIAHSIRAAIESRLFERILVSTEDEEISETARNWGAETPFRRPPELADDYAGTLPVMRHAAEWIEDAAIEAEAICCIYATAPFLRAEDLRSGWERLGERDYVFSATRFAFPIQRAFHRQDDGLRMFFPQHFSTRSQDLPEALHDAGQFYWGRPAAWLNERPIFGANSDIVQLPSWRVQDIDDEEDWKRAELLYALLNGASGPTTAPILSELSQSTRP